MSPGRDFFRPGRTARRTAIVGIGVTAVIGALVGAGLGAASPSRGVTLQAGSTWLPSTVGVVSLLSGPSARAMTTVPVAPAGHDLSVTVHDLDAYVVDRTVGTVTVVNSTWTAGPAVKYADPGAGLQVLAGPSGVSVVDAVHGLVQSVDPDSLARVGAARPVATPIAPGSAALDGEGHVWALAATNGAAVRTDGGGSSGPTTGRALVVAAGQPALVDAQGAHWLDADGSVAATVSFGSDAPDAVVSGGDDGALLAVLPERGVLLRCQKSGCDAGFALPGAGHRFGPAVELQTSVVVPDLTSGDVLVVDPSGEVVTRALLHPTADFALTEQDGQVFYNDPSSARSGVIRLDGVTAVTKYDEADPSGLPAVSSTSSSAPPSSVRPSAPPPASLPPSSLPPSSRPPVAPTPSLTPPPPTTAVPPTTASSSAPARPTTRSTPTVSTPTEFTSTVSTPTELTGPTAPTGPTTSSSHSTTRSRTTPTLQPPTLGAIVVGGGAGGQYLDGDTLTFSVPAGGGPVTSWAWKAQYAADDGTPLTVVKATGSSATFTVTVDSGGSSFQQWYVSVVARNGAGQATASTSLRVGYEPTTTFTTVAVSPSQAPPGANVSLQATFSGDVSGCSWTLGTVTRACDQSIRAPETPGPFTVTATVTGPNGRTSTSTASGTIGNPPTISAIDCPTATVEINHPATCTATVSGADLTWIWTALPGPQSGTSATSFTFTPGEVGSHTVGLTVRNPYGSKSLVSAAFDVEDSTDPTGTVTIDPAPCCGPLGPGFTIDLTATDPDSGIADGELRAWFDVGCDGDWTSKLQTADLAGGNHTTETVSIDYHPLCGSGPTSHPAQVLITSVTATVHNPSRGQWFWAYS